MELIGTLKKIGEIQTFASGFQKREVILLTEEQYPQPILIELLSDNVDIINTCKKEDKVKFGINIRGREWLSPQGETKYFNSIIGWRVDKITDGKSEPQQTAAKQTKTAVSNEDPFANPDDDDLPF